MNRRNLVKTSGVLVAGSLAGSLVGCKTTSTLVRARSDAGRWVLPKSLFDSQSVVVFETDDFPVGVYRVSQDHYAASVMRCTHQNCETSPAKGGYICPCHGSRFSSTGEVLKGPATERLTELVVVVEGEFIAVVSEP